RHTLILANGEPTPGVPEIPLATLVGTYGTPFTGRIEAVGRLIVEYGAIGLPEGLTVDPATGAIQGAPLQVGAFTVQVSARNAAGTGVATIALQVGRKALGVAGLSAASREYDGTTVAPLTGTPVLVGVVGNDDVVLGGRATGRFDEASVGQAKRVVVSGHLLSGTRANHYTLADSFEVSADILKRPVSLPSAAAATKEYDGTTSARITGLEPIFNRVPGDDLRVEVVSAEFSRATVGTALEVTATFELAGAAAINHRLIPPTGLRGDIVPASVTIQLAGTVQTYTASPLPVFALTQPAGVAVVLTYDGKTNAPTAAGSYAVLARTVGENHSGSLAGVLQIQPKTLAGRVTVADKAFDGSTLATVTRRELDGVVAGDTVSLGVAEARFADALLGAGKPLSAIDPVLQGSSAANYRLGEVTVSPAAILNNPPVIDPFPRLTVVESRTLQEQLVARDGDLPRQTLVFRLLQGPTGVSLTTGGLLQWALRRTDIPGTYQVEVEVSDGVTNARRAGVITVTPSGIDPVVLPVADASAVENTVSGAVLTSPDPDLEGALSWSLVQGPQGFAVAADGRWSWQPGESLGGTRWTIVAEATDGRIRSRVSFRVDVVEDNQPPVWLATPPPVLTEGRESVWTVGARD
ncbi:MAG: YDG domain-containing protein, partial [Verrucomicrobiota bacterium]